MDYVDARGLACPAPVLKAKERADRGSVEISVYVDNEVAAANVRRFFEGRGYSVIRTGVAPDITILGKAADRLMQTPVTVPNAGAASEHRAGTDWSLLLLSDKIGANANGLGEVLMKAYLGTILQSERPPGTIALMNEGVMLALPASSTCDTLAELAAKGVRLLICGTCVNHFGVAEEIKIGMISNMLEITEAIFSVSKPVVMS